MGGLLGLVVGTERRGRRSNGSGRPIKSSPPSSATAGECPIDGWRPPHKIHSSSNVAGTADRAVVSAVSSRRNSLSPSVSQEAREGILAQVGAGPELHHLVEAGIEPSDRATATVETRGEGGRTTAAD